jgi:glycosidase
MLEGDPRRVRMVYSLLFTLPGTPVLYYGEEIGMGEDLSAEGRLAVRTPMQWSSERNGGFSTAAPRKLVSSVVDGAFGPEFVNVADQRRDPESLWNFVRLLIQRYRECPELGWGDVEILDQPERQVFAHRCTWEGASIVAVHNLSNDAVVVPLQLDDAEEGWHLVDLLVDGSCELDADGRAEIGLDGYGHRWLRVRRPADRRLP